MSGQLKDELESKLVATEKLITVAQASVTYHTEGLASNTVKLRKAQELKAELTEAIAKLYPSGPRQWDALADIPKGVDTVVSAHGTRWRYQSDASVFSDCGQWRHNWTGDMKRYKEGPFTEVIAEPEPRVWQSANDIPEGVVFRNNEGLAFKFEGGRRYMAYGGALEGAPRWDSGEDPRKDNNEWMQDFAPFTEILEENK